MLRFQLEQARGMTKSVMAEFESRNDWLHQVHPNANNAIWIVAHLALADNYMMKFVDPSGDYVLPGLEEKYWFGTQPTSDDSAHPPVEDVLAYFEDRRQNLLNILNEASLKKLAEPVPGESSFSKFPNQGQIFLFNSLHEGIHFGQLTVCHRGLGKPPLKR